MGPSNFLEIAGTERLANQAVQVFAGEFLGNRCQGALANRGTDNPEVPAIPEVLSIPALGPKPLAHRGSKVIILCERLLKLCLANYSVWPFSGEKRNDRFLPQSVAVYDRLGLHKGEKSGHIR
jgi:hypothetical protein